MTNPNALQWFKRRRGGAAAYSYLTGLGTLVAAYDFGAGVTDVSGGVDSILDQSGSGNTLSAPAPANRPAYSASDAAFNGQPTGTGDGAASILLDSTTSTGGTVGSPGSLILVAKQNANVATRQLVSFAGNTFRIAEQTSNRLSCILGATLTTSVGAPLSVARCVIFTSDGANASVYIDGVLDAGPSATTTAAASGSALSLFARTDSTLFSAATIAFAAVSRSAITPAQIAAFTLYSQTRWGTP